MSAAVAPEVVKAALETYALELGLHPGVAHAEALEAALAAGIRANEQRIRARIADQAETYAREMSAAEDDPDGEPAFAVALAWFASKVRDEMELDPSEEYEPTDGDVVEVTLVGEVSTGSVGVHAWGLVDDYTGLEFLFPVIEGVTPQVRVMSRAKEQAPRNLSGDGENNEQEGQ